MLKIIEKDNRKIAVLTLTGDPLGEQDAELVREKTRGIVSSNIQHLIFDMSGVKHINSAGLGGLISAMHTMIRAGGTIQFAVVSVNVAKVFKITRLNEIFVIKNSVEEAVREWGKAKG